MTIWIPMINGMRWNLRKWNIIKFSFFYYIFFVMEYDRVSLEIYGMVTIGSSILIY